MKSKVQGSANSRFVSFARVAGCVTLVLGLASACGGQSQQGADDDTGRAGKAGATGNHAGSSSGGSQAHAGSSSSAGSSSAGAATVPGKGCSGPAVTGNENCLGYFRTWTHEAATGLCVPLNYGGCGATQNNYKSLAECQQACPSGKTNIDSCKVAEDCVLAATGCCGVCDGPDVTAHDFVAYNKQYTEKSPLCPQEQDVSCGACPEPGSQGALKYFVPNCVAGECVIEDIRASDVTACKFNDDCRLRNGTACCEACGGGEVVSVRSDGSFEELVCGDVVPPCLACEPSIPSDARATCGQDGHCSVVYLLK